MLHVDYVPLLSDVNRAVSSMSCPHIVSLMVESERTDCNKDRDLACRDFLARFSEHQRVALRQSKQDVNVIISYSSSSKLGNRWFNKISRNVLKVPGMTGSCIDRLCVGQPPSIVAFS